MDYWGPRYYSYPTFTLSFRESDYSGWHSHLILGGNAFFALHLGRLSWSREEISFPLDWILHPLIESKWAFFKLFIYTPTILIFRLEWKVLIRWGRRDTLLDSKSNPWDGPSPRRGSKSGIVSQFIVIPTSNGVGLSILSLPLYRGGRRIESLCRKGHHDWPLKTLWRRTARLLPTLIMHHSKACIRDHLQGDIVYHLTMIHENEWK